MIHLLRRTLTPGFRRSQFDCIGMEFYRNSKVVGSCISMNLVTPMSNITVLFQGREIQASAVCFKHTISPASY